MKRASFTRFGLSLVFVLFACASASATITGVSSDGCPGTTCLPSFVTPVVAGRTMSVVVKGQYVDLSTGVEVAGGGVHAGLGARQGGGDSSVEVRFDVDAGAALGERTVKLHYAVEMNGPDVFKVRVVRGGHVDKIEQRVSGLLQGTTRLVDADSIPVNQTVTLVFTGSRLGNAQIAPILAVTNPQTLSGCTETRCEVELKFTQTGNVNVNLFDSDVPSAGNSLLYKFFYDGAKQVKVVGATSAGTQPSAPFNHPILSGGGGAGAGLTDVAPRANILNLFRRTGNSTTFEGQTFVQVEDRWCQDNNLQTPATGSAAKLITLPNITWGVTNVGTAEVGVGFDSQLVSNGQVLDTKTIAAGTLHPGATRDFNSPHARSTVRVFRFAAPNQTGCFAKPGDPDFFEDPPLTVRVDTGNAIAGENRNNNSRNF